MLWVKGGIQCLVVRGQAELLVGQRTRFYRYNRYQIVICEPTLSEHYLHRHIYKCLHFTKLHWTLWEPNSLYTVRNRKQPHHSSRYRGPDWDCKSKGHALWRQMSVIPAPALLLENKQEKSWRGQQRTIPETKTVTLKTVLNPLVTVECWALHQTLISRCQISFN